MGGSRTHNLLNVTMVIMITAAESCGLCIHGREILVQSGLRHPSTPPKTTKFHWVNSPLKPPNFIPVFVACAANNEQVSDIPDE